MGAGGAAKNSRVAFPYIRRSLGLYLGGQGNVRNTSNVIESVTRRLSCTTVGVGGGCCALQKRVRYAKILAAARVAANPKPRWSHDPTGL